MPTLFSLSLLKVSGGIPQHFPSLRRKTFYAGISSDLLCVHGFARKCNKNRPSSAAKAKNHPGGEVQPMAGHLHDANEDDIRDN